MKKFILIMFLLVLVFLQLPFVRVGQTDLGYSFGEFFALLQGGLENGELMIAGFYIIPFLGIVISAINIFIKNNISALTAITSLIGLMHSSAVYFFYSNYGGSFRYGFIFILITYLLIITISVVSLRVKED